MNREAPAMLDSPEDRAMLPVNAVMLTAENGGLTLKDVQASLSGFDASSLDVEEVSFMPVRIQVLIYSNNPDFCNAVACRLFQEFASRCEDIRIPSLLVVRREPTYTIKERLKHKP